MSTVTTMLTAITNYFTKVENRLKAGVPFVWKQQTVAANASISLDLTTQTGATTAAVDWRSAGVTILYYDTITTSPTYQTWTDASAMVSFGVSKAGLLKVGNLTSADLGLIIKVTNPAATPVLTVA